ncbi:pyridoxamine 5'-phosphate oxidase family protein [Pseudomonas chlororaphis]|uniref:pyridoxamine 5'-phosphate oxidase family protein n=1 Tax=Pseudomonas chlororaphis TaxID=587753 RepID=UPI0006A599FC|nr:pyridoxamine 5'-phosphate oxidase family protein [Pseudomonas chlororaphis]AZC32875.1 Phosphohydrolase (MutT/nudix family protein) [Pseudomonas chlororaphis subsp. piscium]QTT87427.1 pyridoxamine 5'-phosphate oxidase family protein [Pseudomonas chlororaphis]WDG76520.1 pyridoxamine 5'-phosphate oxidase family protein [Pseudomonas chlororaphis]WDG84241.1 pyridoxamine 5'-phosphate oxidase family protein [Pseudomonas chlororaphis]WDG90567.1 pyridoxamine 5'-phosphate oxidase family protein [Pseu
MLTTLEQLEAIYGLPLERAVRKEIPFLNPDYQAMVRASPLVILSTSGPDGMDGSPRGDAPGFVRIIDERTLALPDRPGNNRIDSLRNIVSDPRVALLFIIPGIGETLRVNGRARISAEPALLDSFAVNGKPARTVILVDVEAAYFHCSKAIVRSDLWNPEHYLERSALPSAGAILKRLCDGQFDADRYDREMPERVRNSLY